MANKNKSETTEVNRKESDLDRSFENTPANKNNEDVRTENNKEEVNNQEIIPDRSMNLNQDNRK